MYQEWREEEGRIKEGSVSDSVCYLICKIKEGEIKEVCLVCKLGKWTSGR